MQTKKRSMIETVVNTAVGLIINITAQRIVFPIFDMHISVTENLTIAVIFTIISVVRSYCMRRIFNKWEVHIHGKSQAENAA